MSGKICILFYIALLFSAPCWAQVPNFALTDGKTTEVTADDGLELRTKESRIYAYKNAFVKRGGEELGADTISADYRKGQNGSTELWRLNAIGNVVMNSDGRVVKGDTAEYLLDGNIMTVNGKPASLDSTGEKIRADILEYDGAGQLFTARNNAKIIRDKGQISADVIFVEFAEGADKKMEIKKLTAEKNVVITTAEEKATGDKAVYSPKKGEAVLTGNVKLTKSGNNLQGEKVVVNLNTGISKLFAADNDDKTGGKPTKDGKKSRIKGVFLPDSVKKSTNK